MKTYRRILSLVLCFAVLIQTLIFLTGCQKDIGGDEEVTNKTYASKGETVDLMEGISRSEDFKVPSGPTCGNYIWECAERQLNFGLEILKRTDLDKNVLVSPLSIITALAMTMNGADGETKAQFEKTYGMSVEELSTFCCYFEANGAGEESPLKIANSIWMKTDPEFKVKSEFLQANANYFGAGVYKSPFDEGTIADINKWVSDNTKGMIPKIVDNIDANRVMFLINALSFESRWLDPYLDHQIRKDKFKNLDGKTKEVDFLHETANGGYIYNKDLGCEGFVKAYAKGDYGFAAILPKEGTTPKEFLSSVSAWDLQQMLINATGNGPGFMIPAVRVHSAMPKFKSEYSEDLADILSGLGIEDAFSSEKADLSKLGTYDGGMKNLYIGEVMHKTYIEVDENGTKAAAATSVGVDCLSASIDEIEIKEVILDRPFVYMIVDMFSGLPVFIGVVNEI